jgi:serine/threonine protein phosphatase 1
MTKTITYAIGDVHGCFDKLIALLNHCDTHCGNRKPRFVFLGDYVDRGRDSKKVVDFLMRAQTRFPDRFICLKGNHEQLLAAAAGSTASQEDRDVWIRNGGRETLESYQIDDPSLMPPDPTEWLGSLPATFTDGKRLFVHAGISPGVPIEMQEEDDLLWIREPFLSSQADHGFLVVHGHTPTKNSKPDLRSNRLNLDTGACFGGPLTAAAFLDDALMPFAFILNNGQIGQVGAPDTKASRLATIRRVAQARRNKRPTITDKPFTKPLPKRAERLWLVLDAAGQLLPTTKPTRYLFALCYRVATGTGLVVRTFQSVHRA